MAERDVEDIFYNAKLKPSRIRLLKDPDGKFKGAAFVEFDTEGDANNACKMNGTAFGDQRR